MKLLLTILSVLVAYGVAYGLAGFIAWEINPMYWTSEARRLCYGLSLTDENFAIFDSMGFEEIDLSTLREIRQKLRP